MVVYLNKKRLFHVRYAEPYRRRNRQKGAKPMQARKYPNTPTPAERAQLWRDRLTTAAAAVVLVLVSTAAMLYTLFTF